MSVRPISQKGLEKAMGQGPVLVRFTAPWCGACAEYKPVFSRYAASIKGKAKAYSVDVRKAEAMAKKLGIRSIPATVLFVNGRPVVKIAGTAGLEDLRQEVGKHL